MDNYCLDQYKRVPPLMFTRYRSVSTMGEGSYGPESNSSLEYIGNHKDWSAETSTPLTRSLSKEVYGVPTLRPRVPPRTVTGDP